MAATAPVTIAYAQRTQGWELVLTNGKVVKLPGALAKAPADTVNAGSRAPFLVSGDGKHFLYFRKSDGLFVERTLSSKERVVARDLTTNTINEEWPWVSNDGGFVITGTSAPGLGVFADVRKGKILSRAGVTDWWSFMGFTPDSKGLLLEDEKGPAVFDRELRVRVRLKKPVEALANDYATAAVAIGAEDKERKLRLFNARTGRVSRTVSVRLPSGQYIDDLDFDQAGRLVVRSKTKTGVAIYRVSKTTGKTTLLRAMTRPDVPVWVLPGDTTYEPWTEKRST
ncbi:hypothetical protein SAMN05421869_108108 [Nonomuraea jiangxiensis]|uniref:WD40-like Beta Propeller Repeat n=1 Tax=Nonomuraea jiangxiensis TaxID=633440 RepID=A0A1G8Q249_9ACTN|nr:hypothetical protein SAMN05421869_108108 [Nonomuraea jiangxiensis]